MAFRLFILFVLVLCCSTSYAEEAVEISLDEVWALDMPGTKNIRELDPPRQIEPRTTKEFIDSSLLERTIQTLNINKLSKNGGKPGRAFLVVGTDVDALKEANAVLSGEKERAKNFPADEDLTLVFYVYSTGQYVQLESIERKGNIITVSYKFVPHRTLDMSSYLALIPLGNLPDGKKSVHIQNLTDKDTKQTSQKRVVCEAFSFMVQ